MEISGSTAFYAGLSTIQSGQNRVDQAAGQIANTTVERSLKSQSSDSQVERLLSLDRSQQDLSSSLVDLSQGKLQVELGAKVEKASDQALGTLIDTYA
ncbi:hypothetical protein [Pseudomonas asplenii]|uniref:hypothetical protein n=1 Tax=Pseudomonas asplenii TaxID=53407 RepID=UPI00036B2BC7|nr:hypothetical protein [Pseudomonas fuscovaginae]